MRTALGILLLCVILQIASTITACSLFYAGRQTSKLKCVYLTTDSLFVNYTCSADAISGFTVINHSESISDTVSYTEKFPEPVVRFKLPILRESIVDKSVEIVLEITNSTNREGFSIYIKPGDLNRLKRIYCSYSHNN
jgi:hypothetical protein